MYRPIKYIFLLEDVHVLGCRVQGIGVRVSARPILGFFSLQDFFCFFFVAVQRNGRSCTHTHTHTHSFSLQDIFFCFFSLAVQRNGRRSGRCFFVFCFDCKIFFLIFFLWLFRGMGKVAGGYQALPGCFFVFFSLQDFFSFFFLVEKKIEEWEKLLEDIKHYPDPNIKVATFDVD